MTNGSIESKDESDAWPVDSSAQTQSSSHHDQEPSMPGDLSDNPRAGSHLPPLPRPRPPSPVSVAELQERAVQDSENNNVDENSNDRHYDEYAAAAYPNWEASFHPGHPRQGTSHSSYSSQEPLHRAHISQETSRPLHLSREASHLNRETSHHNRETSHTFSRQEARSFYPINDASYHSYRDTDAASNHLYSSHYSQDPSCHSHPSHQNREGAFHPELSVRPRVRRSSHHYRDELDHAPPPHTSRRNSEGNNRYYQFDGHCQNQHERNTRYPPLPNLNRFPNESGELLPQLPNHGVRSYNRRSSQELRLRSSAADEFDPRLPVAVRSSDSVTQEAEELLTTFTSETLRNNSLDVPQWMVAMPSPHMVRAGRELRLLADAFACTAERRKVQHMAESVNLDCIEMDDFFHLCAEVFYDGITRERIVALFTFVGDVAVYHMKMKGEELIHRLMKWSLRYFVEHVCRWVQEAGGWIAVLTCGANFLYRCAVFVFCVCGSVAASLFIYKTLKNG